MKRRSYTGLYIDTETGGLDPRVHALTSICIGEFTLFPDSEPEMGTITLLVIPAPDKLLTTQALDVQGLTREALYQDARRLPESVVVEKIARWLRSEAAKLRGGADAPPWTPLPVWAHNADFDRGFVSALASRCSLPREHPIRALAGRDARWSCTRYLSEYLVQKGRLELPTKADGTGSVSLDPLLERLGIPGRQGAGHDAHEDVRLGVAVVDALLKLDGWWD